MRRFLYVFAAATLLGLSAASAQNCLGFPGTTSGLAKVCAAAAAGTPNQFNVPTTSGANGNALTTDGSNNTGWATVSKAVGGTGQTTAKTASVAIGASYAVCTPTYSSVSSGTSETALAVCKIPGGTMATNQAVKIDAVLTRGSSPTANTDVFRFRIGAANNLSGIVCTTVNSTGTTVFSVQGVEDFINAAATNANYCIYDSSFGWDNYANTIAPNIDTTADVYIVISGQPGVSGDTLAGQYMRVNLIPTTGGN